MHGVVYLGNGQVKVEECPRPEPGPGEVLIEMRAAGICGSDLHKYHQDEAWARARNGMIAGHEPSGVIVDIGSGVHPAGTPGVEGRGLRYGDRVSVYHSLGCGRCEPCLDGMPVLCEEEGAFGRTRDGCHADYMTAPAWCCLPLPDDCSFATGAMLACTAGTAWAALEKAAVEPGEAIAVFGLGPVGMTVLLIAAATGRRVLGFEPGEYRRELAERIVRQAGYHERVITGSSVEATIASRHTGQWQVCGAVECSGNGEARSQAVRLVKPRGNVVLVGVGTPDLCVEAEPVIRKEITLRGNAVYSTGDYFRALACIEANRIDLDAMITHRFSVSEAEEAYRVFDSGMTGKVVFEWEGADETDRRG